MRLPQRVHVPMICYFSRQDYGTRGSLSSKGDTLWGSAAKDMFSDQHIAPVHGFCIFFLLPTVEKLIETFEEVENRKLEYSASFSYIEVNYWWWIRIYEDYSRRSQILLNRGRKINNCGNGNHLWLFALLAVRTMPLMNSLPRFGYELDSHLVTCDDSW